MIKSEELDILVYYLHERESIRRRRIAKQMPLTRDPILGYYRFTNVRRSDDRTTRWAIVNWYNPNLGAPLDIQAYACVLFRYFGSTDFAEALGYPINGFEPEKILSLVQERRSQGLRNFTAAYVITNGGRKDRKEIVVVNEYLANFWMARHRVVNIATRTRSFQQTAEYIQSLPGFGAFMAKEVSLDMQLTAVLPKPVDGLTWCGAGPGAIRGLNRLHGRPVCASLSQRQALDEMRDLVPILAARMDPEKFFKVGEEWGVADIQFCLCEYDKYRRTQLNQGSPKQIFRNSGKPLP